MCTVAFYIVVSLAVQGDERIVNCGMSGAFNVGLLSIGLSSTADYACEWTKLPIR